MAKPFKTPKTENKVALAVFAHADDLTLFAGGLVRQVVDAGWTVHSVRVSDDRYDSWGTSESDALENNHNEFEQAMKLLGVKHTYHLGYRSDFFADIAETQLRTEFVTLLRKVKPYSILTYDPDSIGFEDNVDHKLVAQAMSEAAWVSGFDRHPDSNEQIKPHLVAEKWYCGRMPLKTDYIVNRKPHQKILKLAIAAHVTPLLNMQSQWQLIAKTRNVEIPDFNNDPQKIAKYIISNHPVEKYRVIKNEIPTRKELSR
jgi:LmbE family N-acetylglucosaminyl deacetylase